MASNKEIAATRVSEGGAKMLNTAISSRKTLQEKSHRNNHSQKQINNYGLRLNKFLQLLVLYFLL